MKSEPLDPDFEDPRVYEEISSFKNIEEKLMDLLD